VAYALQVLGYLAIAVLIGAFGIWRIRVGLYRVGVTERPVRDLPQPTLPKWMRGSDEAQGWAAVIGGTVFLLGAVVIALAGLH
jgi:hypothetical protein